MQEPTPNRLWRIHDIAIGLLAGGGAGGILGLLIAVRNGDNHIITWLGAALGAALITYGLVRSHRSRERFVTVTTVFAWVLLASSVLFVALVASAISSFT